MKSSYAIVIFIFIFSLMGNAINELGIYDLSISETGLDEGDISEITDLAQESVKIKEDTITEPDTFSLFAGVQMVINAAGVILKALWGTVVIFPTLTNMGVPASIAIIGQAITNLVEYNALAEFISGRRNTT